MSSAEAKRFSTLKTVASSGLSRATAARTKQPSLTPPYTSKPRSGKPHRTAAQTHAKVHKFQAPVQKNVIVPENKSGRMRVR